ncbi:MAG TPA: TonB-dependent receptor [Opitutaceae bacterium]|nr:TonB-dependent receptor [Opitutaceae bacterium]
MSEENKLLTTNRKALTINLDGSRYGTIAEIGAGQEVARIFFQAGSASGSIAKTMSAYDMTFSDAIYGKAPRYVSRERLETMLQHEFELLRARLSEKRGDRTRFFVFADTVATKGKSNAEGHGWLGIRFQMNPGEEPSDIIIHVRTLDKRHVQQQEALGIIGVNLIYGAFYQHAEPEKFIESLVDNLGNERVEVDMLRFSGPAFRQVDNRLLSLCLVKYGLTNAVMFSPAGDVLQPSEVIYNRPVLVERGSFRPVTHVNVDMLNCATAQFLQEPMVKGKDVVVLMEITMNNLLAGGALDERDFLSRVDMLGHIGFTVLISNYSEFYRLVSYFRRYTKEMIGVALGINNLLEIFNEKYYENLEGGILESMGRMFRHAVKLYCYPMKQSGYDSYLQPGHLAEARPVPADGQARPPAPPPPAGGSNPAHGVTHAFAAHVLITARNLHVADHLRNLYAHLLENHYIDCITGYNEDYLAIFSRDVLQRMKHGDDTWEKMVPRKVAEIIKERHLFGYGLGRAVPAPAAAK